MPKLWFSLEGKWVMLSQSQKIHSSPEPVEVVMQKREACGIMLRLFTLSGLPLVVEDLLGVWRICLLCAHLCHLLLCEQGIVTPLVSK